MAKKAAAPAPDLRPYINPQPGRGARFGEAWQREKLPALGRDGEYVEDKKGTQFNLLLRSLRGPDFPPGPSIVVVRRLFCLAPWTGSPTTRKREMARRVDLIKAAGAIVMEGETGKRTDTDGCAQMLAENIIDMQNAGRAPKHKSPGRPPKFDFSDADLDLARGIWLSREWKNDKQRVAAIKARLGRAPGRTWCINKFGSPNPRAVME